MAALDSTGLAIAFAVHDRYRGDRNSRVFDSVSTIEMGA
jgi:hypothetical protein